MILERCFCKADVRKILETKEAADALFCILRLDTDSSFAEVRRFNKDKNLSDYLLIAYPSI